STVTPPDTDRGGPPMRPVSSALLAGMLLGLPGVASSQSRQLLGSALFAADTVMLGRPATVLPGDTARNGTASPGPAAIVQARASVAADVVRGATGAVLAGPTFCNALAPNGATVSGPTTSPLALPLLALPAPPNPVPGVLDLVAQPGAERII